MTTWDNADFDREANAIARSFWDGQGNNGAPLNELATKVARDNTLNPEQIRRLCRTANVRAFEQKHAALKGAEDRTPRFELADAESVISNLYQNAVKANEKVAFAEYPDLADEYAPAPERPSPAREKLASIHETVEQHLPTGRSLLTTLRREEKRAEELRIERATLNMQWEDCLADLHKQASYQHWDHEEFEKNIVALYGGAALPELNTLRSLKKMAAIGHGAAETDISAKLASLQASWVGCETAASRTVKTAMDLRQRFFTVVTQQDENRKKLAEMKRIVRHG